MIQLALETTGTNGSLAVLDGKTVLWDCRFGVLRRTAADIACQLDTSLRRCEDRGLALDAISVAVGPGSFTGLRIAITTAKTLAYALGLPVIPVGSLAAIAAVNLREGSAANVLVGLNAYRRQVFAAEFSRDELCRDNLIHRCNDRAEVVSRQHWDERVADKCGRSDWAIAGDRSIVSDQVAESLHHAEHCDAVGVGWVATGLVAGSTSQPPACYADPFSLTARYLKLSAAEEKAALR
ncbi:tRNA (adenosine(37)-N6)-threonylcarbamoyltransferase complex dimerization subunit type 1 TsaB [Stieleria sp. ICT_E10.1]|uniref:tRNA (adenosine(37)-N6)-threonylcarbamoyltransferase complex dimerization subunit type 1 TsaB n=1 Tax=Stieleria sedimenti TaxID=2976331 RepID=UPI00217F245E|nr:tRNA (adenosine(37)-N6)-threonylcarbamoyltransferase complex dimerization subunit type 1 TsaB [Stieleria sedimenti]MCS7468302.1 tRNA (adenosine(37)-N6)-threonylcarbamoyltransferase complex dimerization subunit type 1 TsaB [Stieleria sedimenti]